MCSWLTQAHPWWAAQPWAEDVTVGIERCWRQLRALARIPKPVELTCSVDGCHGMIRSIYDDGMDRTWPDLFKHGQRVDDRRGGGR